MFKIMCITNRHLVPGGEEKFLERIEALAEAHPSGIILREKDLPEEEYLILAARVAAICKKWGVLFIPHTYPITKNLPPCTTNSDTDDKTVAASAVVKAEYGENNLHVTMDALRKMPAAKRAGFDILGASVHSAAKAKEAEALGCTYVAAGHVFDTDCKMGLPGRGLGFLREVCESVGIPVYAIGGINASNIAAVKASGAGGACVMSGAMTCENPAEFLKTLRYRDGGFCPTLKNRLKENTKNGTKSSVPTPQSRHLPLEGEAYGRKLQQLRNL